MNLLELTGFVALLLWGLRMVRTGILRSCGSSLKRWARLSEGSTVGPFVSGLFVAAVLQSSTATAMIAASFSAQNIISISTALIIMLGADVGTSLAVLIASQQITFLSPILITLGFIGFSTTSSSKQKGVSRSLIGLGLILLSLSMISANAAFMADTKAFMDIFAIISKYPFLLVILGIIVTYLAHSSVAVVLLAVSLVAAGTFAPSTGIYVVLGANVGSGLLLLAVNWRAAKSARTPVVANLILRTAGVVAAFIFAEPLAEQIASGFSATSSPLILHITLNCAIAIFGLMTARLLIRLTDLLISNDPDTVDEVKPKYLDDAPVSSTNQALASAKREALRMADIVQGMLIDTRFVLKHDSDERRKAVSCQDDDVDRLFNAIKLYVAEVLQRKLNEQNTKKAMDLLSFTANLEHIGDIIDTGLMGLASKKIKQQVQFSEDGWSEIDQLLAAVSDNFDLAINTFISDDPALARQLVEAKPVVRDLERSSIETHFERLGSGHSDTLVTSSLHLDVLRDLKRINSHLTAIAYPVLAAAGEMPHTRWNGSAKA